MRVSPEAIEAARTPAGGWTKAQLAEWGVPWPPPKGWRAALESGIPLPLTSAGGYRVNQRPSGHTKGKE